MAESQSRFAPAKARTGPTFSSLAVKILQLDNPNIKAAGFIQAVRKAVDPRDDVLKAILNAPRSVRPDAWVIDEERGEITVYEIEDSHPMSIEKLEEYVYLDHFLDDLDWSLRLIVTDRYAMNRRELDLRMYEHLLAEID